MSSLVPAAGLLGRNAKETALVDQWMHFAETELLMPASTIYIGIVMKYLPAFGKEVCPCHTLIGGGPLIHGSRDLARIAIRFPPGTTRSFPQVPRGPPNYVPIGTPDQR